MPCGATTLTKHVVEARWRCIVVEEVVERHVVVEMDLKGLVANCPLLTHKSYLVTFVVEEVLEVRTHFISVEEIWIKISTLEMIIEDIQVRHRSDIKSLLDKIRELKNHKGGSPGF
uniref:Uncharacterized protein n=1 Tax=Tanacetum cinerariifolium TaxID=118510 RepID=A0A6L2NTQ1_TANCI|nr:hypothetical protein [Tanacetum cinerariifolium]